MNDLELRDLTITLLQEKIRDLEETRLRAEVFAERYRRALAEVATCPKGKIPLALLNKTRVLVGLDVKPEVDK